MKKYLPYTRTFFVELSVTVISPEPYLVAALFIEIFAFEVKRKV